MILSNSYKIDESLFHVLKRMNSRSPVQERLSVTHIPDSPRVRQLLIRHWDEIECDVSEQLFMLLGISAHSLIEQQARSDADLFETIEEKLTQKYKGLTIAGKADVLTKDGCIKDWKTTSCYTLVYNPDGRMEWFWQVNVYKWMFEKAGYDIKKGKICAILRDWSRTKMEATPDYPRIPYAELEYVADGSNTFMHSLLSNDRIEEYLEERVGLHLTAAELPDEALPPCTREEKWQNPSRFAVMKGTNKTAKRVLDTKAEALVYIAQCIAKDAKLQDELYLVERPSNSLRCQHYCPVRTICSQRLLREENKIVDMTI